MQTAGRSPAPLARPQRLLALGAGDGLEGHGVELTALVGVLHAAMPTEWVLRGLEITVGQAPPKIFDLPNLSLFPLKSNGNQGKMTSIFQKSGPGSPHSRRIRIE